MSSTVQPSTFLPGGINSLNNNTLALAPPYIFVIILCGLIFILIVVIIIREILYSHGILRDCCNYKGTGIQCLGCQECCASCAETCNCCGTTSIESCLDACCPKRSSIEFADIITCEACCTGQCCSCGGTVCVCAPTDVSTVNCLCCACEQQPYKIVQQLHHQSYFTSKLLPITSNETLLHLSMFLFDST